MSIVITGDTHGTFDIGKVARTLQNTKTSTLGTII